MKRKVKFQEGGAVPQTANEMSAEQRQRLRNIQLREMMEKSGREGKRVGLAERARQRQAANQAARRATAADRAAVERLNPGQGAAEVERRAGRAVPERRPDFTTGQDGTTRRGAATGREMVPAREGMPATQGGRGMVPPGQGGTPRQIPLFPSGTPQIPGPVASAARRFIPGLGILDVVSPTSLEAGAEFEREGLRRARAEQMAGERSAMEQEMGEAPQRMPTPRPAAPARRAAPAAREISADRLNDLMMGAEPANAEERVAQMRMRGRQRELEERGTAFRKGGMVKPKAAPKKMMKGGMVAKPKVAAKSKAKPMPFKKGGVIKKGRK